jgi:hypothetical protein
VRRVRGERVNGKFQRCGGKLRPCGCGEQCDETPCGGEPPIAITLRFSDVVPCVNVCVGGVFTSAFQFTDLPINDTDFALAFDYCDDLGGGVRDMYYSGEFANFGTLEYFEGETDCDGTPTGAASAGTLQITLRIRYGSLLGSGALAARLSVNGIVGGSPLYDLFTDTDIAYCSTQVNEIVSPGAACLTSPTNYAARDGTAILYPDCSEVIADCPGPCTACTAFAVDFTSDCTGDFPSASFTVENTSGACVWTDTASGYTITIDDTGATVDGNGYTFVFEVSVSFGCITGATFTFSSELSSELPGGCDPPTLVLS